MDILALDYTGNLPANYFLETKNVQLEADRLFALKNGAFYQKGLVVTNVANGQVLTPGVDYKLYELEPELQALTGGNVVYYLIHVFNRNVGIVSIAYHAVGGKYQVNADFVAQLQERYVGGDGTYPYGNLSQKPIKFNPIFHLQSADTIMDAGALVNSIHALADSIANGDPLLNGHLVEHIQDVAEGYQNAAQKAFNDLAARLTSAEGRVSYPEGHIIVTDSPENPAVRYGGYWILNPDILLHGASTDAEIGDLLPIAAGTGVNARKTYIWSKGEDLGQVTFNLAASATAINEGGSVTFTLTTTGLSSGTQVPYQITGGATFNAADIAPTPLNGRFTINSSGVGTVTVTAVQDVLTEGNEVFTLSLANVVGQSRSVTINDTSRSPSLTLTFSANPNGAGEITQINEGQRAYLVITSANLQYPHTLNLTYSGSVATAGDFTEALPTSIVLTEPTEIISFGVRNDRLTEGNETFLMNASSATFTVPQQRALTIRDTSLSPSYSAYFSANATGSGVITERNEGQTFYLVINTVNVDDGTVLNLVYSGTAVAGDFNGTRPATATISANRAIVTYTTLADSLTEGNETMAVSVQLDGVSVATREIAIIDTSQNPQFEAFFRTAATGTNYVTQRNEGQTVYFGLRTTGVASGTTYTLEYAGTVAAADFTSARPTSITVGSDGEASVLYNIGNDFLTEGAETLIVRVKSGSTVLATATLNIVDTSVNPTYAFRFSASSNGTGTITQANEGATVYLVVTTTNVATGTSVILNYPTGAGLTNAADFNSARPTTAVINSSGEAIVSYQLKNDFLSEGDETFRVTCVVPGINLSSNVDLIIKDTSVPTVSAYFSASSSGTGTITQINEGQVAYLVVNTTGYPSGKVFNLTLSGMVNPSPVAGDWAQLPPSTITVNLVSGSAVNGQGIVAFAPGQDFNTDGNKTLGVNIRDPDAANAQVGTASVIVTDTSRTPVINSYWATSLLGNQRLTTVLPGGTVYFILETQNLPNGSAIDLTWDGGNYPLGNLLVPLLPTTVYVNDNRVAYAVNLAPASAAWGVRFQQGTSFTMPEVSNVNEGSTIYMQIKFDLNDPNDNRTVIGPVYFSYPQDVLRRATAPDFTSGLPTELLLDKKSGTIVYGEAAFTIGADVITEGDETLTVDVYSDAARTALIRRAVLTINDTSQTPEIFIDIISTQPEIGRGPIDLYTLFTQVTGNPPVNTTRVCFVIKAGSNITGGISAIDYSGDVLAAGAAAGLAGASGTPAIVVGQWPTGSQVRGITENGANVLGRGGAGGMLGIHTFNPLPVEVAKDGGPCIVKGTNPAHHVTWENYGFMASGAGGGGFSGRLVPNTGEFDLERGNSGGGGASYGLGGAYSENGGILIPGRGIISSDFPGAGQLGFSNVAEGGTGGLPGQNGQNGAIRQTNGTDVYGQDPFTLGGQPGLILAGPHNNFLIINRGGGVTAGR